MTVHRHTPLSSWSHHHHHQHFDFVVAPPISGECPQKSRRPLTDATPNAQHNLVRVQWRIHSIGEGVQSNANARICTYFHLSPGSLAMRPRRSRSSGGGSSDADSTSRLLIALLGFALVVFASTICLLAAGLAAHIDDEELNAGVEGRLQGGGGGGGVVQQQQREAQYLEPAAGTGAAGQNNGSGGDGDIGGIIRGADTAKKAAAAVTVTDAAKAASGGQGKALDTMAAAAQNAIFPTVDSDFPHLNPSVIYDYTSWYTSEDSTVWLADVKGAVIYHHQND